jgi:hypothetical protein
MTDASYVRGNRKRMTIVIYTQLVGVRGESGSGPGFQCFFALSTRLMDDEIDESFNMVVYSIGSNFSPAASFKELYPFLGA